MKETLPDGKKVEADKGLTLGGSRETASSASSSTMQQLCYLAITFSCTLCFAPLLRSLGCNETQYLSSHDQQSCCNKCRPGHYVVQYCTASSPTKCKPCEDQRYIQTYNMEWSCDFCGSCSAPNMEYKSHCNATHDSVCKCKPGYECTDRPCTQCRPVSPTTRPPPPVTPVTVITVETSKGYLLAKTHEPVSPCSDDEEHRDGSTPDAVIAVETTGETVWTVESTDVTTNARDSLPGFKALREI
ncbi:Tumor necrosis factor receptor superfamily member 11B [Takifugu flavidus]|uniref:Tumor necrosis factor receptor superfamily member 11B n=1 Tax=Takifugu flavidus TaxID=433684 RepID=A0A5C6PJI6_9TELE|nr:Tumor necrosis factor receptor superfamily member 11B [Takifugu flavidus]